MAAELANKAFCYSITTTNTTVTPTSNQDPFNLDPADQNLSSYPTSASRYNSDMFHGFLIDTRAAKRSTGGYGQFLAL
jgi:hypothetical protein